MDEHSTTDELSPDRRQSLLPPKNMWAIAKWLPRLRSASLRGGISLPVLCLLAFLLPLQSLLAANKPPVLAAISNQTITVGMTLTLTNVASDPESPPEVLTFSLGPGAATNASINPATGVFTWTPSAGQVGTKGFKVVVTDNGSPPMSATQSFYVVVVPRVVAGFSGGPTSGVAPLAVTFTNSSSGATNYAWAFGDGNTSTNANPVNTYSNAGTYSVSLTARGPGGTNMLTRANYIVVIAPVVAGFSGGPTSGVAPLAVTFTNSSSGATNYAWAFGDGNTSTNANPVNTYSSAGTYSVSLTATGPGGTNMLTRANYIVVIAPVVTGFSGGPTSGVAPLAVTFTNSSSGATNYAWAFGDGNTSTNANPVNTYSNAGTYSVSLTATGAGGTDTLTRTNSVLVGAASTLTSIAVTPATPTLFSGAQQPFTATGTYSDGHTQTVTSQASWSSAQVSVATIDTNGVATAISIGSTTVSAGLAGVTGSTLLTVQAPVTLWPSTAVPVTVDNGPDSPVELGVKFRADVAGTIVGIRFYKASLNTAPHIGNLWNSAGTLLASATFTNESLSGWQQVNFASPVPIAANDVYVASYHATNGHYSRDSNYFAATGVDNGPLHALANGVSGPNGVAAYGASPSFPNQASNAANYWVDVAFQFPSAPTNPIVLENWLPGSPSSQWDIANGADTNIQGFATQISVNKGETVHFKINTSALGYRADIYRLGYYQGKGARLVASVSPSFPPPQIQPACLTDTNTGLMDYGNWAESASWTVPTNATSGIYIAKLVRTDTNGASHIIFVVRDDSGSSDVLFKTSDTTWQAYNDYGGNSLYVGAPAGRAYKVSYNRPFNTRADSAINWVFNAEYPMVRWLEANGYNVSYTTSLDTDVRGSLLRQHKLLLSVGHDEYWSGGERTNVEAAVSAGVHLAFFSGNEVFWKTRWEPSIDGSATPYRTLVCYKETLANAKIDPSPLWTGTWRDPRYSPPADGGRPENKLTGTLFGINESQPASIQVPASLGAHRFWRNTSVATLAAGATAVFPLGTIGFEWDTSPDNGFRPPGLMQLSSTVVNGVPVLVDYGSAYSWGSQGPNGVATHNLCLYRHASGALVFGAGTVQWSWGLDSDVYNRYSPASPPMQQATVNLLADMGIQPGSLQATVTRATPSTDFVAPSSTILTPGPGVMAQLGNPLLITGTANDTGGSVWGVEVSTDGGANWRPAAGFTNWSYIWTPIQAGRVTLLTRAVDDSGNLESPGSGVTVSVPVSQVTLWPITAVPGAVDVGPDSPVELGVKFRADVAGTVIGVRFYKGSLNTGTHVGNLWSSAGALLASATFANETPFGWQQVNFASPVPIAANTIYVASYHASVGHYSRDGNYFATGGVDNPPLHAPASGVFGPNGVYAYGTNSTFPNSIYSATANYWVDVAFQPSPTARLSGTNFVLTWSGPGIIQSATNVAGPYFDVPGAVSPLSNGVSTDGGRFFRLRYQ
jgi:PKD repeat protein